MTCYKSSNMIRGRVELIHLKSMFLTLTYFFLPPSENLSLFLRHSPPPPPPPFFFSLLLSLSLPLIFISSSVSLLKINVQ